MKDQHRFVGTFISILLVCGCTTNSDKDIGQEHFQSQISIPSSIKVYQLQSKERISESFYYLDGDRDSIHSGIIRVLDHQLENINNTSMISFFQYDPSLPESVEFGEENYPGSALFKAFLILRFGGDPADRLQCVFFEHGDLVEGFVLPKNSMALSSIKAELNRHELPYQPTVR